jgi:hypothetical protein
VPNTKVVANIQIYLHVKFHIFLRPLKYSLYLFPRLPENLNGKRNSKIEKPCGPFSPRRPAFAVSRPISAHELARLTFPASLSLTDGVRLSALSSSKSLHLCSPAWQCRPNWCRRASHPSPPRASKMSACVPVPPEPSRRLRCIVASHHRCRCSTAARRCSSRDAHARSSATKSSSRPPRWPSCHGRKHAV